MIIEYLQKVVENPVLNRWINRPLSIQKIEELEEKFNDGRVFPKAFREYLYLAGDFNNFAFDDLGENLADFQDKAGKDLEIAGQKVDRPFFAFDVYNSQYSVIFLDERDDDPAVYLISPFLAKRGTVPLVDRNGWVFSSLVNENIRRVKNNIAF